MALSLQFAVSNIGTEFKAAMFRSPNEKNDYCDAENSDRACINAYLRHRKSATPQEAKNTAYQLAKTRFNFHKKWEASRKKSSPKIVPPPTRAA